MQLKSKYSLLLVAALLIILLYPIKILVIPKMTLQAVDKNGSGVPNVRVEQSWQHYSFESSRNEETIQSDEQGYVSFPERTKRVFLVWILLDQTLGKININPHASSGPYASFLVDGYDSESVRYEPTEEIPTQIIIIRKFEQ